MNGLRLGDNVILTSGGVTRFTVIAVTKRGYILLGEGCSAPVLMNMHGKEELYIEDTNSWSTPDDPMNFERMAC